MKKYVSLLLAIVFCLACFAGCKSETADDPSSATLEDAVEYLKTLYKSDKAETLRDYDRPAKVKIGTTEFTVTWKTNLDSIKVKASTMKDFWTIDLPDANEKETKYTLTATVKDSNGKTKDVSFERILPVINNAGVVSDIQENTAYKMFMRQVNSGKVFYAIGETDSDKYIKTTEKLDEAIAIYAEKAEGGYKFYATINGAKNYVYAHTEPKDDGKVSKFLSYSTENASVWTYQQKVNAWFTTIDGTQYVMGTYGTFNTFSISEASYISESNTGVSQFPAEFLSADAEAPTIPVAPVDPNEPAADSTLSVKDAITLGAGKEHDTYTTGKYYVSGVITEVYNEQYGNMKIADAEGNVLTIYGTYSADGQTRYDGMATKPVAGDTVKVYGIIGQYKDTAQMKNGWIVEHTPGNGTVEPPKTDTPAQPTEETAVIPVVGTAYRLFFVQKNVDNKTFYLTGDLKGYYANTSEKNSEGADFYIEATDGGYHLTCTVAGAKKYANVVKSGDYINIKFDDIAKTVWTINETLKTVETELNEDTYILGTKADGTYTTLGPMSVDSGCMYAQFTANVVAPSTDEPETEENNTPVAGVSDIKVDTPYYISGVFSGGNLYFDGTMGTGGGAGRIMGVTDASKAAVVKLEAGAAAGEYYIYFMDGSTKTYLAGVEAKSGGFAFKTEKDDTCVWLIDASAKTIISKNLGNRGIATQVTSTYLNFSTYSTSNFGTADYDVSWFVAAE